MNGNVCFHEYRSWFNVWVFLSAVIFHPIYIRIPECLLSVLLWCEGIPHPSSVWKTAFLGDISTSNVFSLYLHPLVLHYFQQVFYSAFYLIIFSVNSVIRHCSCSHVSIVSRFNFSSLPLSAASSHCSCLFVYLVVVSSTMLYKNSYDDANDDKMIMLLSVEHQRNVCTIHVQSYKYNILTSFSGCPSIWFGCPDLSSIWLCTRAINAC